MMYEPGSENSDAPLGSGGRLAGAALDRAVRRGAGVATTAHVAGQLLGLLILAVLYRLIGPEQFGLVAMVLPVLALVQIFTTPGINVATVQRATISHAEVSWLFWANMALSVGLGLFVALMGYPLAWFFRRPEVTPIAVALAGTLVVSGLGAQHRALLERELRMVPLAKSRFISQAAGGMVAIAVALRGGGVWALVAQHYAMAAVLTALLWHYEPWRPTAPRRERNMGHLVRFGGFFTASGLLFFLAQYVDKILVGWAAGAVALGLYSQAFNLMTKPVYLLTTPLASVMLPAFSRAANDRDALARLLLAFSRMIGLLMMPAAVGLFLVAPEAMQTLGGERWLSAGPVLRGLSLAILVQAFVNMAGAVYTALGRAGRLLLAATALAACLVLGVSLGLYVGGKYGNMALGVAWGYSITMLVVAGPYMRTCFQTARISTRDWLRQLVRPALAAAAMGVVLLAVRATIEQTVRLPAPAFLATQMVLGSATYVVLARGQIRWLLGQLRQLRAEIGGTAGP